MVTASKATSGNRRLGSSATTSKSGLAVICQPQHAERPPGGDESSLSPPVILHPDEQAGVPLEALLGELPAGVFLRACREPHASLPHLRRDQHDRDEVRPQNAEKHSVAHS